MRRCVLVIGLGLITACGTPAPIAPAPPTTGPTEATASPRSPALPATAPSASPPPSPSLAGSPQPPVASPSPATATTATALVEAAYVPLPATLHPYPDATSFTQSWLDIASLIWGRADGGGALLMFDWSTLDFRPALASALPTVSADNRVFTFALRPDLRWSDGAPLTAADFQFAFDNASRPENHFAQVDLLHAISGVRTPDPGTVEITLADARPRDVAYSIIDALVPVPEHTWRGKSWTDPAANAEITRPSVVLGPFALTSGGTTADSRATFAPVPTYPVGQPRVTRVDVSVQPDPAAALDAVARGQANWLPNLPQGLSQQASANPALEVQSWTPANAAYRVIEFNTTRSFLSDRRVRQALALVVNRSDLITQAENGLAVPQVSFVQPTNERWLNTAVSAPDADLDRARQLLADAGYTASKGQLTAPGGQAVRLQVVYPTSSGPRVRIASYIQAQYGQLGIGVDLKGLDFAAFTDAVSSKRDFDVSLGSYGGGSIDPDLGPKGQLITSGPQNVTGYANAQLDDIFRQAGRELDPAKRKALYDQAQQIVATDMPIQYLYALKTLDVFSRAVQHTRPTRGDRSDANGALLSWSVGPP